MKRSLVLGNFRFSMRVTVLSLFLIATLLTAAVAIGLQYYFNKQLAQENALNRYREAALRASEALVQLDRRALEVAQLLCNYPGLVEHGTIGPVARQVFAATLQHDALVYAIYIGLENGNFFELVNLNAGAPIRYQLDALPQDRWVTISIENDGRQRQRVFSYYDEQFQLRTSRREASTYQPHKRPWFTNAVEHRVHKTPPYLFQHLQAPGQTYSTRIAGTDAVLAVDIALSSLSRELGKLVNDGSTVYLYQENGNLIAASAAQLPASAVQRAAPLPLNAQQAQAVEQHPVITVTNEMDWPPFDFTLRGEPCGFAIEVLKLVEQMTGLRFRYINGLSWSELLQMFQAGEIDILQPVVGTAANSELGLFTTVIAQPPLGILTRKRHRPPARFEDLAGKRVAIVRDWSIIPMIAQRFPAVEIIPVASTGKLLEAVRQGQVEAAVDTAAALKYLMQLYFVTDLEVQTLPDLKASELSSGLHLVVSPALPEIAELIDQALARITPAQWQTLEMRWLYQGREKLSQPLTAVPHPELVRLPQKRSHLNRLHQLQLAGVDSYVFLQQIAPGKNAEYFAVLTPATTLLAPAFIRVKTGLLVTGGCLLLLLPLSLGMANLIVKPVQSLALENEKIQLRHFNALKPVTSRIRELHELSSSMTLMARAIQKHVHEQDTLMEAFMHVIAQAIDAKSKYTAGHCERVPKLAEMLARAADSSQAPSFKAFHFTEGWQWREFRIGAWLHDCGKISTPEHVVDKGTKLETIYNRIHEIRTRFEVLWRDTEILYLQRCLERPGQKAQHLQERQRRQQQLQQDFAFIAACNEGREAAMTAADQQRLEALGRTTWQRHFDDRLGLSLAELKRSGEQPETLPATETLLADKPWHRIEREKPVLGRGGASYGLAIHVPEYLYNFGEIHNLKIARGTLTEEDRFKVAEHVINTIKMLSKLPLPKELQRVPRYASTHHERLDGTGYPRQLQNDELTIPERIIALADIFEALTAPDRPYKQGKSVREALDILYDEVQRGRLDQDLFELFLTSGVFQRYAQQFLAEEPDIVSAIDISQYLRHPGAWPAA
ncbi:HD domain-containing phosphohydrolase [Desulfuromonas thiophila]|uniref:HD domain-containing phosphohydrolase n=1 Tax=Desulfuromonas thiophila TaxID=57664 RepID=UPI0024A959E6|nr:HD domain-containing phosphohydrolase [Desulfuromonas thiophila]